METVWWVLIIILFLLAYAGLVLLALPDIPFILGGFLLYHFLIDNTQLGWPFWITVVFFTIVLFVLDYVAGGLAAKKYGGSNWSMIAAVAGVLIFPFFLGPLGIIVGPFLLVFLVELMQNKDTEKALKIALGTLIGFLGSVFVKFLVITGLIIWFVILVFL
ncbi:DUF456 domain-containing protein [Paenactinomyces guangxiensis]|uniref:DUF456 family protein n=1 Tax=Paenactinomyces guangxiensis TaxID=1490290 RepID=A0A7W2A8R7_9BACL|nr:DUF456 domain-containing protein [Paenactinomyces guangxiensis]MBA4494447.1 DUF456 family protein [Paenactinomyces guangxiensis]MBH8591498.1 DUF456 family protein [Paenactinomyces guangxiensis]